MAYSAFHDELLALFATATGTHLKGASTASPSQTLFTSVEAARLSAVEAMKDGLAGNRGRPAPPYGAVQIGQMVPDVQMNAAGGFYMVPVTFALVDALGNTTTTPSQKTVHAILESFAATLESPTASFTNFWREERGAIDSSEENVVFSRIGERLKGPDRFGYLDLLSRPSDLPIAMPAIARFSADFTAALADGMREGLNRIEAIALKRSSGTKTASWFARNDHPLAKRHGAPGIDPSTINVRSGAFRRDWKSLPLHIGGGEITAYFINDNPVADFLKDGTRFMFARPVAEAVEAEAEPLVIAAIEAELERIFNQTYS
jgi:hypothetical protein